MKVVGARIPRYDGVAHVTGRTTYVDDGLPEAARRTLEGHVGRLIVVPGER